MSSYHAMFPCRFFYCSSLPAWRLCRNHECLIKSFYAKDAKAHWIANENGHFSLFTAMDKTNAVVVWIMNVHFAIAPALIRWFEINSDTLRLQLLVEFINILHPDKDHAAGYAVTGKRGKVEFDVVTRHAHVARVCAPKWSIRKGLFKTKTLTVKLFRRG